MEHFELWSDETYFSPLCKLQHRSHDDEKSNDETGDDDDDVERNFYPILKFLGKSNLDDDSTKEFVSG